MMINGMFPGKLYPNATVGGCIDIFENAWPDPEGTIEAVEAQCNDVATGLRWSRAETLGDGVNQNRRTNYDLGITVNAHQGDPVAQAIHNQMYMLLMATSVPYADKYGMQENMYHEGYNMLKYSFGQEYKAHYDGDTATGRSLSAIVYLNSNYEGGEVEFTNFGVKIKPQPGMLLLFPSNYAYTHIAHPVTSGTKYAIVTWIHDRPI
jgi:predicted 2-oxoglutarate/Fe(II)-dependent dioxygenase YbiX